MNLDESVHRWLRRRLDVRYDPETMHFLEAAELRKQDFAERTGIPYEQLTPCDYGRGLAWAKRTAPDFTYIHKVAEWSNYFNRWERIQ